LIINDPAFLWLRRSLVAVAMIQLTLVCH